MDKRILVVDDEKAILDSLRSILGRVFQVSVASGTEDALRMLREEEIDAIVVDGMMPHPNDGVRLVKAAFGQKYTGPVVMHSSTPQATLEGQARAIGLDPRKMHFVRKGDAFELRKLLVSLVGE